MTMHSPGTPARVPDVPDMPNMPDMPDMPEENAPARLLLVEDNPDDVEMVRDALTNGSCPLDACFVLDSAPSLHDALRACAATPYAVILLDLLLPDADGTEALEVFTECSEQTPLIVLTNLDDENLAIDALKRGAQDYLIKEHLSSPLLVRAVRYAMERHKLRMRLHQMSTTDELTGLHNRRGFFELAEQQLNMLSRVNHTAAVTYFDMDGLKTINDTKGHLAGDAAIRTLGELLDDCFRTTDVIGRLGGDEFAVFTMLRSSTTPTSAMERFARTLAAHNTAHPDEALDVSWGTASCAELAESHCTLHTLLVMADERMYDHKMTKRGTSGR